ncbi:Cytochrome c peroxidase, mitochondrial [Golovinomyces cichoracearum]|uniref:Peroxidase n=1 Tax=Golovinomyces cichoracearum TaxID=62708 RepID=A0A420J6E8_9PEZI|nr:Cytochrome c peroxidase, mitochondrial [Golovinomyces cichoracearum]
MASTSGRLVRVVSRSSPIWKSLPRTTISVVPKSTFRQQSRRGFASGATKSNSGLYFGLGALALAGGGSFYLYNSKDIYGSASNTRNVVNPKFEDYQKVYNEVAARLIEKDDYDDGSYGPVLVRLAWHASGTYDKETGTGGSNGATMRFAPESNHGANSGLSAAREFLEPIKEKFPWISYSDLWILAGVVAIQEMQGPLIPWRPGRQDKDMSSCTPDGRLPDATQGRKHLRDIFGRMGFNDQEIVALSGAHALGRCHVDRSGFEGPWTFSPTTLTNDYFRLLLEEKWHTRKWNGPKQYEDKSTKTLMMLPTDMSLISDKSFVKWVSKYAKDNEAFFKDFSNVIVKLFELGVPFPEGSEYYTFKPLHS